MNKILANIAISALIPLTLAFVACGGDISTDINVQGSSPIPRGSVIANIGECGHNSASFGKAYMTNTDNGGFQVVVPDMHVNDEWQNDELLAERVGDTLHVWEERETFITLEWVCYAHHTFDISAEDSDVKYFKYFDQVFEVLPGPAPEKVPDTIIEDTSMVAPNETDSTSEKKVIANNGECSQHNTNFDNKAYLTNAENGGPQIVIADMSVDNEWYNAELLAERVGDTLHVWKEWEGGFRPVLAWICYAYHTFDIPAADADIKYFKYFEQVFEVVPGSAPEKAPDIDSVYYFCPSSSGEDDSLCYQIRISHTKVKDFVAQCGDDTTVVEEPERSMETPTAAYKLPGTDSTSFIIEHILKNCGYTYDGLDVSVFGDTLFVNAAYDMLNPMRCVCPSKVEFKLKSEPGYANATVLVYMTNEPEVERIVMPIATYGEQTQRPDLPHQAALEFNGACKKDRQTLERPAVFSDALLPELSDTIPTKLVKAERTVGADGFDTFVITDVYMTCGAIFDGFDVYADGDTLYVDSKINPDSPVANCLCSTRIEFKIEHDSRFSNTGVLVFDRNITYPLVDAAAREE